MKNFNIFLDPTGTWRGNEFPDEPVKGEYELPYAKAMKKYNAAVEKLKSEALEVSNIEDIALKDDRGWHISIKGTLCAELVQPGVLYPWDGGCKTDELRRFKQEGVWSKWYSIQPEWADGLEFESRKVLRLLPKSPVTTTDIYDMGSRVDPSGKEYGPELTLSGDEYPVIDHPHHTAPTVKTYVPQGGIVATGVPEQSHDIIGTKFYDFLNPEVATGRKSVESSPQAESHIFPNQVTLANSLLDIRDQLVLNEPEEAYHLLCKLVDPELLKKNHWEEIEKLARKL